MSTNSIIAKRKFRKPIQWALRAILSLIALSLILTGIVQIPYVQTRIVTYATEIATESLGLEIVIGSVELHPFYRSATLSDITCSSEGVELLCAEFDMKYKGSNPNGVHEMGEIKLDGVRFFAESIDQINAVFAIDSDSGHSNSEMFFERFEITDFDWQIGDSLSGSIELFSLDSIFFETTGEIEIGEAKMGEGGIVINIGGYEIRNASTDVDGTNLLIVETSIGDARFANSKLDLTVDVFKASGMELKGEFEISNDQELGESVAGIQLPDFDIDIILAPSFITPWVNNDVKDFIGELDIDELKGEIICKDGKLIVNQLYNSEIRLAGMGSIVDEDIVWDLTLDLEASLLNPWTQDLKVVIQDKSPKFKKTVDEIRSIHISAQGSRNNIDGVIALSRDGNEDRGRETSLSADYSIDWNEGGFADGWESHIHLDSLETEYGNLENLNAQLKGEDGHVEVKWDNDILEANTEGSSWELYSRLNGYAEWNDKARGGKLSTRLNFRKPILIDVQKEGQAMRAPINFDRFDILLELNPDINKNLTKEKEFLDIKVESDLILGDATFSLDTDVWKEWLDLMIHRDAHKFEAKSSNANTLITKGHCEILRSEPISALLGTAFSAAKGTEFTWFIDNNNLEAKGETDWIEFDDLLVKRAFLDISGRTNENWINIEAFELLKSGDLFAQDMNIDIHADTVWTADLGWENFLGIEGIVRVEGLLEQEGVWGFDIYEATIPLGNDTLELTRIPSSLSLNATEISSDGMSWTGGGFKADIEGEMGDESERPLSFLIHSDGIDSSRTKNWFNVPVSLSNLNLSGSLGGTISDPELNISGEGEGVSYGGESIPKSEFKITYSNNDIEIQTEMSGFGESGEGIIKSSGSVTPLPFGDFSLNLKTSTTDFPLSWANTILNKETAKLGGGLDAAFTIQGPYREPKVIGGGVLKNAQVKIEYLGTEYDVSGKFDVKPDGIELNGLSVKDSYGGEGFLVGTALHENYEKWNLDISMSIEDPEKPLEIMNIARSPDAYFYGNANAFGDINVFGYEDKIHIEARLKTTKGTEFVLPMDVGTNSSWSSFVEIIDHSNKETINPEAIYEEDRKTSVRLDLIIDVDQESEARVVFDEAVGDEIIGKCEGVIHLALDDFERLAMFGSLKVIEGEYLFTLSNFINKRFVAEPGGTIKWYGDPYKAEIDLKTLYSTRTSLLPITPESLDNSKQKVDLILEMNGDLMRPGINFDISLPEGDSRTKATLASLLANEEEMNRQAISLLILQQFLPPQWQAASIGSTGLQENSTELISAQLGNWLSGMSDDVNIGIDYDARNNSGDEAALAVALSTQLLNDRLHVEGELGTQSLNTGSFDDLQLRDFRIKYDLKDDGTLQLTGYSTQRANIPGLEGESVQGVGILFHRNFNRFGNLFGKQVE